MLIGRIRDYLTTGHADSHDHKGSDRRQSHRKTVFLRATIYPVDVFCDARIRDVSVNGVMGEADVELAIGQTLHVTTDEEAYHLGKVKWTRDRRFGLELQGAAAIFGNCSADVDHGSVPGHHPRAPRIKINAAARLVAGKPPRPATIRNVSATGMLIDTSPGLHAGQHLVVRVGNAPAIYGRAQWSKDGKIGFKAHRRISVLTICCAVD